MVHAKHTSLIGNASNTIYCLVFKLKILQFTYKILKKSLKIIPFHFFHTFIYLEISLIIAMQSSRGFDCTRNKVCWKTIGSKIN